MTEPSLTIESLRAMPVKVYAGIGSRKVEKMPEMKALMTAVARLLGSLGFRLRTGGADGADTAFERGAPIGLLDLFLPWPGFNGRTHAVGMRPTAAAYRIAAAAHPHWLRLSDAAKSLHARNAHQVLGATLDSPAAFVLCWTPDGATRETTAKTGGTGQAIRIAVAFNVPVYNLARADHREAWEKLLGGNS